MELTTHVRDHLTQAAVLWRQRERFLLHEKITALDSLDDRLQQHILFLSRHPSHWSENMQTPEWTFVRLCALLLSPKQQHVSAALSLTHEVISQAQSNSPSMVTAASLAWSFMILRVPATMLNDDDFIQLICDPILAPDPYAASIDRWTARSENESACITTRRTQWIEAHQKRLHG